MELASTLTRGPCSEYRRLQIGAENSSFCGAKGRLAHYLEAQRDALYKSTTTTTTTTTTSASEMTYIVSGGALNSTHLLLLLLNLNPIL